MNRFLLVTEIENEIDASCFVIACDLYGTTDRMETSFLTQLVTSTAVLHIAVFRAYMRFYPDRSNLIQKTLNYTLIERC